MKQQLCNFLRILRVTLIHHKREIAYLTILALLVTAFCSQLFAVGLPAGTDLLLLTVELAFVRMHSLWFSLWMSLGSFGYPIFFGTQFNLVLFLFDLIPDSVLATKLFVYSAFILSGFSMYLFTRNYTHNYAASTVAAVTYLFNPIFLFEAYSGHHTIIFGYAVAPIVFLTYDRALKSGKIRDITFSAVALTTLFLTGHPETIYIFGLFLILFAFVRLFFSEGEKRRFDVLKRVIKVSLIVIAITLLLSAYEIIPLGFNAMQSSVLYSLGYTLEDTYAYSSQVYYVYLVGVPLLFLLTFYMRKNRYTFFFSMSSLISAIISMGPYPPFGALFTWAFLNVPLFDIFRVPYRFSMMTAFSISFLIGMVLARENGVRKCNIHTSVSSDIKALLSIAWASKKSFTTLSMAGLIIASGMYVAFGGYGFPLGTFSLPDSYTRTYEWIAQQPGDYRISTVPYPTHYVDTSSLLGVNRGWVWDPPVYGQAVHGKAVVTGYGGTVDTQDFLDFISTQILYNRTNDLMKILGTFNVKYVAVHPYPFRDKPALTEPMKEFFTLQKGLTPVYLDDNISVLENDYWTPQVFGATNYALVVGGLDVLTSLLKIDSFNLNQWVLIFANQIDNSDFWKLLEGAGALVFADDGFIDLVMMSTNVGIRISGVDYAFPSSNPSKYWIPSKWWTNQGKLVLSGATLRTNASIGLDLNLNLPTTEEYTAFIRMAFAPDRGTFSVFMDGSSLATILPYANASAGFKWVNTGSIPLNQGEHTLRIENDGSGLNDIDEIVVLPTNEFASETNRVQNALASSQTTLISVSAAERAFLRQEIPEWYLQDSIEAANGRMLVHNASLGIDRILGYTFVPAPGEYVLAARINATTGGNVTIGVDDSARLSVSPSDLDMGWRWVSSGSFNLVAGEHTIFVDATRDAKLDEIALFSTNGLLNRIDRIFDNGSQVSVNGEYVNSYTYQVKAQSTHPFLLVFSESYHPMWEANIDGQSISSLPAYSFVNAFFVPEGSHEISVEFTGQNYVTIGELISSTTIICLVTLAFVDWKLKKKAKSQLQSTYLMGQSIYSQRSETFTFGRRISPLSLAHRSRMP